MSAKGKRMKQWFDSHPIWVMLSIFSFVLTLAIAASTVYSFTTSYIENNILWRVAEQKKIDELAPTQTLTFFNSLLGEPNTKSVLDDITTYTYKERGYWVEAFVDNNGIVQLFDITACGEDGFYPRIKNNPVGDEITLSKTRMINTTAPDVLKAGQAGVKTYYYLRGATAPSYYYDEYYGGNPSSYQTVFAGHNELCGFLVLPKDIEDALYAAPIGERTLTMEQIDRLRSNTGINTVAISSPSFELKVPRLKNIAEGGLGVSYIDEGVLLPPVKSKASEQNAFDKARDFEVVKLK